MTSRGLIALADARVPRYTSYPTATQFGPLYEATYRGWLRSAIRPADTLSLYVHVPFCRNLCWYCGCLTRPTRSEPRIDSYAEALLAEFGRAGIDVTALSARLQQEGAQAFEKSWNDLIGLIAAKCDAAAQPANAGRSSRP